MSLRKEVPFLGEPPLEKLPTSKLPLKLHVFLHLFFFLKVEGLKESVAVRSTAKAVIQSWDDAGLKPKKSCDIVVRSENGSFFLKVTRNLSFKDKKSQYCDCFNNARCI